MKNKIKYFCLLTIIFLSACSTDLDVIGKYKETMVVYGLLDQSQTKQYIKINKAFLGEGNAIQYAQVKDSTQYVNALNVVIKKIKNGTVISTYNLNPDNSVPKDPGTFYYPDQANAIYSFNTPAGTLASDCEYQLEVKNNETGTVVGSNTVLVYNSPFSSPIPSSPNIEFITPGNDDARYSVRWRLAKNAKVYQFTLRFNYFEFTTPTDSIAKYVDWVFPAMASEKTDGVGEMALDFRKQDFLRNIGIQLKNSDLEAQIPILKRAAANVDFMLVSGASDLYTFMEVNAPSTGIIQEKPNFTNIVNGLGIYSARLNNTPLSKPIGPFNGTGSHTLDSLSGGRYTCHLKFLDNINGTGTWTGCH